MKRYYNETTKEWYYEGRSITRKLSGGSVFAGVPNETMLKEWGFVEKEEPENELSEEEQQRQALQAQLHEIEQELASMDYLTSKYIDGEDMSEYGDWQERRRALRERYRELEAQMRK